MQCEFLQLSDTDRKLALEQAALRRGLLPVIMEKDFWVCWMLGVLFSHPEFGGQLVFKGGTSLSKIHGVIHRFSEDIDLSVAPAFLQIDESAVDRAGSTTQCGKWMKMLEQSCAAMVGGRILPELERVVAGVLGAPPDGAWLSYALDEKSHSPLLLFDYPTLERDGYSYLRRTVKMEFGSLTDQQPVGRRAVRPWVAEVFQVCLRIGAARSLRWNWSARSGRKRPSCMPSTIAKQTSPCRRATRGTTQTW